jgi:hypothetical protein
MCLRTGSFCQYLRPSQRRLLAAFSGTLTSCTSSFPRTFSVKLLTPSFVWASAGYACHGSFSSVFAIASISSGPCWACSRNGLGGVGPPSVMDERKPSRCRPRARLTCSFETGIDVRPRRALDAFWRCEHTCARLTRDMLEAWEPAVGGGGRVCANARRVLGRLALQWLALALVGQQETAWRWWIDYGSRCTALGRGVMSSIGRVVGNKISEVRKSRESRRRLPAATPSEWSWGSLDGRLHLGPTTAGASRRHN